MHTIWKNSYDEIEAIAADLREEYPDMEEDELTELAYDLNREYLEDERDNLDIDLNSPIIVIADLGLWNGRCSGYKEISSGNIRDCLYSDCEYLSWYVDDDGDFKCRAVHHDGVNHYRYRVFKPEADLDELEDKIYYGKATEEDIQKYTDPLGNIIGQVYGW